MTQRRISEEEIDEVLAAPETSYDSHDKRRVILGTVTSTGRRLKVVVLRDDSEYVVTVADRDNEE